MTDSQVYYLDTSALVKRYAQEDGSARVQALCEDEGSSKVIGHIGLVETIAALNKKQRQGTLGERNCAQLIKDFLNDTQDNDYIFVAIDDRVINQAADLAQQYPLRGYDAVHLSCALTVKSSYLDAPDAEMTFVAADGDLLDAARAEGFDTERPEDNARLN